MKDRLHQRLCTQAFAFVAALYTVSVSGRALSYMQLLRGPESPTLSHGQPDQHLPALTEIESWNAAEQQGSSPALPEPGFPAAAAALAANAATGVSTAQLLLNSSADVARVPVAAPAPDTPPLRTPLRGAHSPGLLAVIADLPDSSNAAAAADGATGVTVTLESIAAAADDVTYPVGAAVAGAPAAPAAPAAAAAGVGAGPAAVGRSPSAAISAAERNHSSSTNSTSSSRRSSPSVTAFAGSAGTGCSRTNVSSSRGPKSFGSVAPKQPPVAAGSAALGSNRSSPFGSTSSAVPVGSSSSAARSSRTAATSSGTVPTGSSSSAASSGRAASSSTASSRAPAGSNSSSSSAVRSSPPVRPQRGLPPAPDITAADEAVDITHVPERCIIAGSALFSSCAMEIYTAQAYFNLTVPFLVPQNYTELLLERGVSRAQVLRYLAEALASPSDSCCAAQCCFNQLLLCDCEPSVVQVAVRFAGADAAFYGLMVAQLARSCGIKSFYGDSCPSVIAYSGSTTGACTGATPWPPVHKQQQPREGRAVDGGGARAGNEPGTPSNILCLASTEDDP